MSRDKFLEHKQEDPRLQNQLDDSDIRENLNRVVVYNREDFAEDTVED